MLNKIWSDAILVRSQHLYILLLLFRVFVLLPALARILMEVSDVFAREVLNWMRLEHFVSILMSVTMILDVMKAVRIVWDLINVAVLKDSNYTSILTNVLTKMNALIPSTPVEAPNAPTLSVVTTVAARMVTSLT